MCSKGSFDDTEDAIPAEDLEAVVCSKLVRRAGMGALATLIFSLLMTVATDETVDEEAVEVEVGLPIC